MVGGHSGRGHAGGLGLLASAGSDLPLIANTAPVAFGTLGTPVITLARVHGYDLMEVTAMIGRQPPFFSVLVPFWLIWAFAGRKGMMEVWPAILVAGVSFVIPQYLVSNFIGPNWWTSLRPSSLWRAWLCTKPHPNSAFYSCCRLPQKG